MTGLYTLKNLSKLPGPSSLCGSPSCTIFKSGASSYAWTELRSFPNGAKNFPHSQQLQKNIRAFGSSIEKSRPQRRERRAKLGVGSETIETTEAEEKQEQVSTSATLTSPPEDKRPLGSSLSLEERGSWEREHPYANLQVGKRWREMQGEKNWEGLLDPLDPVLRGELIRYGEFTQMTYDSFDSDTHSRFCGSNKYSKSRLFRKMGLENRGYEVTDYIYGTAGVGVPLAKYFKFKANVNEFGDEAADDAWDRESNWIGYIAVTTDPNEIKRLGRRDIVVVWRGTITKLEWLENFRDYTVPSGLDPRESEIGLKVEAGFLQIYISDNEKSQYTTKSARRQVLEAITRLVRKYADEELSITVAGHSLGSALAKIAGYDIAETGVNQVSKLPDSIDPWDSPDPKKEPSQVLEWTRSEDVKTVPVTVYSFGGPRVGNDAFRDRVEELGVKVLRVVNQNDVVARMPGLWLNENIQFLENKVEWFFNWLDSLPITYTHVGVPLYVDNMISPFLKKTKNPDYVHNLEGYLHVLSGFHALGKPFVPAIFRDVALVNKSSDFLHVRHVIPPSWWQEENKGLVRREDGSWASRDREKVDYPEYDLDKRDEGGNLLSTVDLDLSSIE